MPGLSSGDDKKRQQYSYSQKGWTSRFVQDYRKLNKATYIPSKSLPRIDDSLKALKRATLFSPFDLLSGYWQCALSPEAKEMVAFRTKSGGYIWKVLRMGCVVPRQLLKG